MITTYSKGEMLQCSYGYMRLKCDGVVTISDDQKGVGENNILILLDHNKLKFYGNVGNTLGLVQTMDLMSEAQAKSDVKLIEGEDIVSLTKTDIFWLGRSKVIARLVLNTIYHLQIEALLEIDIAYSASGMKYTVSLKRMGSTRGDYNHVRYKTKVPTFTQTTHKKYLGYERYMW